MSDETATEIIEAAEASTDIAEAINRIADAADALLNSGLKKRAILVLLKDRTGYGIRDIENILDALPALRNYLSE